MFALDMAYFILCNVIRIIRRLSEHMHRRYKLDAKIPGPAHMTQHSFKVLDFIPMGAFVLDAGYRVLFWNKCLETWTGIVSQHILFHDIRDHFPRVGHPKISCRLDDLFLGGPPVIFSAQLHRYIISASLPDGTMRLQNTMVNAVYSDKGYLALFTLQDVTEINHRLEQYIALRNHALNEVEERRKAEAEISEREALYRSIFEKIPAVKMIIDPQTNDIVDVNTAACYFYGYSYPQLLRMNIADINVLPAPELTPLMQSAISENQNFFSLTHKLASGELREVEIQAAPITLRGQTLLYTIVHDVTERTRAEAALRISENKFRTFFEFASDLIVVHDDAGNILNANKIACDTLGYTKEALLQLNVDDLEAKPCSKEIKSRYRTPSKDKSVTFETEGRSRDGTIIPLEIHSKWIELDGNPAILSMGRDISERKKSEALREDVERITRHDLKNPLSAVLGLSDVLLQTEELDPEQRSMVQVIQDAGYTMLNMINLSLDLYKMETGSYSCTPSHVNILRLVEKIFVEAGETMEAMGLRHFIRTKGDGDLFFRVLGEEMLCYSMLSNLIKNAIEASSMGGEVSVTFVLAPDYVTINIHNSGVVPQEVRDNFFDKYTTYGKANGTGLGTYSAKLMAQVQNGAIGFDTSEENGTTVWVRLPRAA